MTVDSELIKRGDSKADGWNLPLFILWFGGFAICRKQVYICIALILSRHSFRISFQFILLVGPKHGDAGLLEVRDSLEDGGGGKVATGVENASVLVDALDIDAELLFRRSIFSSTVSGAAPVLSR